MTLPSPGLDDIQDTVLANLVALLEVQATGLTRVYIDPADALNEPHPFLVIVDEGMQELRPGGGRREVSWDLRLRLYTGRGDLAEGHRLARATRGRIIDQLGEDITLGAAISSTEWVEPFAVDRSDEWEATSHLVTEGLYRVWIRDDRTFV